MLASQLCQLSHFLGFQLDWSGGDPDLRTIVCAGSRVKTCDICKSTVHTTTMCLSKKQKQQGRNTQEGVKQDKFGREIVYHNGAMICNNFNSSRGCNKRPCSFNQICKTCKSPSHGKVSCPQSSENHAAPSKPPFQRPDTNNYRTITVLAKPTSMVSVFPSSTYALYMYHKTKGKKPGASEQNNML